MKPAIGGCARETFVLTRDTFHEREGDFQRLIAKEAMLFQEFQHRIMEDGEMSLLMIGGKFSHSVLKKAKEGEFRVQDDFGGSVSDYSPTQAEIEFAEKVVAACIKPPIYGRVDCFYDNQDNLALGEVELIEPELWLRKCPAAAQKLADEICIYIEKENAEK